MVNKETSIKKVSSKLLTTLETRAVKHRIEEAVLTGNIQDLFPEYAEERNKMNEAGKKLQGVITLTLTLLITVSFLGKLFPLSSAVNSEGTSQMFFFALLVSVPLYLMVIFLCLTSRSISGKMPGLQRISMGITVFMLTMMGAGVAFNLLA